MKIFKFNFTFRTRRNGIVAMSFIFAGLILLTTTQGMSNEASALIKLRNTNNSNSSESPVVQDSVSLVGPQGPKGDQGIQGIQGPTGPQGPAGPSGTSGFNTGEICAGNNGTLSWGACGGKGGTTMRILYQ